MSLGQPGTIMMAKKYISLFFLFSGLFASAQYNTQDSHAFTAADSIITIASSAYQPHSFLRRLLMGNNYRDVWKEHVKLPVFYFSRSGFQIKELGGGMQTKSLHIVDAAGKEWALRTVEKDVAGALPPE